MTGVALAEVADVNPRVTSRPTGDDLVAFVPMAELNAVSGTTSSGETRSFSEVSKGYTLFEDGDLLVAKITPCFENNKIGQARLNHPVGVGSSEFHVVRPNRELVDDRYLLHFLRQDNVRIDGERRMTGSGGQRRVPPAFLKELRLPLPPLDEQRRAAAILDQADALRAQRRQVRTHLNDLIQAVFRELFSARHDQVSRLDELIDETDRMNYGIVQPGREVLEGVPLIRISNLAGGVVDRSALKHVSSEVESAYRRSRIKGNEILVSSVGSIGIVSVVRDADVGSNIARAITRVPITDAVLRTYVATYLTTEAPQRYFVSELRTVAQPTLNVRQLAATEVPVPPADLQKEFVRRLQYVNALKSAQVRACAHDEELFAALQSRAFWGDV